MSPKQKQLNDRLISIVTIALIILFVLVIMVFIITEAQLTKISQEYTEVSQQRYTPLSDAKVAAEKANLPSNTIAISESTHTGGRASFSSDASTSVATNRVEPLVVPAGLVVATPTAQGMDKDSVKSYVKPDSNVAVVAVTTNSVKTGLTNTQQVLEGTIMQVDTEAGVFLVQSERGLMSVAVEVTTPIYINGQRIKITSLSVGDVVRVEGEALSNGHLKGMVIALIGKTEIINAR